MIDWSKVKSPLDREKAASERHVATYGGSLEPFQKTGAKRQRHYAAVQRRAKFKIVRKGDE